MHREELTPALEAARQRRLDLHEALVDAEKALASPAAGREDEWAATVSKELTHLADAFDHHARSAEGPGGLHEDMLSEHPRLRPNVERIRHDHLTTGEAILAGVALVDEQRGAGAIDVDVLRSTAHDLLARVVKHRERGADLVYEAYNVDIGSGE